MRVTVQQTTHFPSVGLVPALLALLLSTSARPQTAPSLIDDFQDGDLASELAWEWATFSSVPEKPIALIVRADESGNRMLAASGALPDAGTGFSFGGLLCTASDPKAQSVFDFREYEAISFRAATSEPSYFLIRIDQEGLGYDATNIAFPVSRDMQEFIIPLSEFRTGVTYSTALVFTPLVDEPGARFDLMLDDVRFQRHLTTAQAARRLQSLVQWAPSLEIAWQNANFHHRPMLVYFSSAFARPCILFEEQLLEEASFPALAERFILARADVNQHRDLARKHGAWKVPAFLAIEPISGESKALYSGGNPEDLAASMQAYLEERPVSRADSPHDAQQAQRYQTLMIDNFSDKNDINEVGGRWGTFSMGDQGDIVRGFVDLGGGNVAYRAAGKYPYSASGETYGGVYCDLSQDRAIPRPLQNFRWISFICKSSNASDFQIHMENRTGQRSASLPFEASSQPNRITFRIIDFGPTAAEAATIVWTQPNPLPGADFDLVLDDVLLIR